jgi:hypothetical protein
MKWFAIIAILIVTSCRSSRYSNSDAYETAAAMDSTSAAIAPPDTMRRISFDEYRYPTVWAIIMMVEPKMKIQIKRVGESYYGILEIDNGKKKELWQGYLKPNREVTFRRFWLQGELTYGTRKKQVDASVLTGDCNNREKFNAYVELDKITYRGCFEVINPDAVIIEKVQESIKK